MNIWESVSVALEGLAANKMRAALTMLGVIIGVSAVITMLSLAQGAKQRMLKSIQGMGTNVLFVMSGQSRQGAVRGGFGSMETLTLEDATAIAEKCPSVAGVAPEVNSGAQVKYRNSNTNTQIHGTSADYPEVRNYTMQAGRFFNEREVKASKKVGVIGPTTAKNLFGESSPIGKRITIKGISFQIIGVTATKGSAGGWGDPDDQVHIPITTAMRRVFGLQYIRSMSVQAKSMELMNQATNEITELMRKRHRIATGADDDFVIRSQAEIMQMANDMSKTMTLLLGGIASVSLLVGGIGIMNIMLVSVTERTREIGIRKAIGARRRDIQMQFLIEAMVLSLAGGIMGIVLGVVGSSAATSMMQMEPGVSLSSILLSFGFSGMVGIFFGYYPARLASRLDPIDALRYE